jgi:hypothetical protein
MPPSETSVADVEDVGEAFREGRALRPAAGYRVLYAEANLDFRPLVLDDPVPLGRQILESASARPLADYALQAILANGDFEDVRLDEPFDLRSKGAERFVAFRTDRLFRFTLDGRQIVWGLPAVPEPVLRKLAGIGPDQAVFLEVRGGTDRQIADGETVDLAAPGVEMFITAPRPDPRFEVFVVYNGLRKPFQVVKKEVVQALLSQAMSTFGASGDLVLANEGGAILDPNASLEAAGVKPGATLLLRPRTVSGG